jgi:hypothetical protein
MVRRRSLTEGAGSIPANRHTRCEVVAKKKRFFDLVVTLRCNFATNAGGTTFNVRVPGSSPGDVGDDVVAQLAEHHDCFIITCRRNIFERSNVRWSSALGA